MMQNAKRRVLVAGLLFGCSLFFPLVLKPDLLGLSQTQSNDQVIIPVQRFTDEKCNARYEATFEGDLNFVRAYNMSAATPYLEKLQLVDSPFSTTFLPHVKVPVIVTALSSNHFKENMGLLANIDKVVRPVFKDVKIVVFDIGLKTQEEIEQLSIACRCTVRKFPFSNAPPYFQALKGCPWKPIVIKIVLQEYPFVMWMDSSTRFTTANLQPLFDKAISAGTVQVFRDKRHYTIRERTHLDTFRFLNEPPCLYDVPDISAAFVLLYAKNDILEGIINPWVKCALIEECMWTTRPLLELLRCSKPNNDTYQHCHRYDQSVLSILVYRLFHNEMDKHLVDECDYLHIRNHSRCPGYSSEFWLE